MRKTREKKKQKAGKKRNGAITKLYESKKDTSRGTT
jgi:hypothetical protein